ncbi:N-6 DNA methylase [Geodermatophilus arenarius]
MTSAASDTAEIRKARGAFFTPEPVAQHITDWAVRSPTDHVLEPSCGEAAFLLAAVHRFGRTPDLQLFPDLALMRPEGKIVLDGIELHEPSAQAAQRLLDQAGVTARVQTADFFTIPPTGKYDAVIGNPPYVRYQDFSGEARALSRAAAAAAGVSLTGLASSWAAFTVHSALFLKPGGRLGLVLPAELLSVNYAADVRRFLLERFRSIDLVLFKERVFPGVSAEVVLLLADGYDQGPTDHARVTELQNAAALGQKPHWRTFRPRRAADKWTPALLAGDALTAYASLIDGANFTELETWGDTTLGMVTGNNKYFTMSPAQAAERGLSASDLIALSPPGSRHLRNLALTTRDLVQLGADGQSTLLFRPQDEPSAAAWAYIEAGKEADVHLAYKCKVRDPWWRVPYVPPADLFLTYMNADTPRLTTNQAKAHNLNSVHGLYLRAPFRAVGRSLLPLGSLNSVTLVGAETVGRSYGGGLLKLEPREADLLPVPHPDVLTAAAIRLKAIRPKVARRLRLGQLNAAAALVDHVLLVGELGIPVSDVASLHEEQQVLRARRMARGAEAKPLP